MNKWTVFLADSSYTIRRIVELSFSEIEGVEVVSFENGVDLKEKLSRLKPNALIIDTKFPMANGYEICRFINANEALKHIRVYLMKGGFEPLNTELIKDLKYEEIITKPFDSNALVQSVIHTLEQRQAYVPKREAVETAPASLPEDFPEIETDIGAAEGISFSDIKEEIEAESIVTDDMMFKERSYEREEVQPSEEITQGTQPPLEDLLAPKVEEEFVNPFAEEPAKATVPPPSGEATTKETPITTITFEPIKEEKDTNEDTSELREKAALDAVKAAAEEGEVMPDDLFESSTAPAVEKKEAKAAPVIEAAKIPKTIEPEIPKKADKKIPFSEKDFFAQLQPEVKAKPKEAPLKTDAVKEKVEDRLTVAIREMLWEIVPPLAEKIIKEEVEKLKSEIDANDK